MAVETLPGAPSVLAFPLICVLSDRPVCQPTANPLQVNQQEPVGGGCVQPTNRWSLRANRSRGFCFESDYVPKPVLNAGSLPR